MSNQDFPPGTGIRFKNLTGMPQLNGKLGHVLDQLENGRYRVMTTHVNNDVFVSQDNMENIGWQDISKFMSHRSTKSEAAENPQRMDANEVILPTRSGGHRKITIQDKTNMHSRQPICVQKILNDPRFIHSASAEYLSLVYNDDGELKKRA